MWALVGLIHGEQVSITVHEDHLLLTINGERDSFARIIEQVCWLVGVAGDTPTSRLAKFVEETKQGTTTRQYTETIRTGHPIIKTGKGCRFHVTFSAARIEKDSNQGLVRKSGHCWKTMTGLSIIASGFTIPSRPRHGAGLEAPLFVLRQLFKRGYPTSFPLPLDNPLVMFPPSKVKRVDKAGKVAQVYQLRLIVAADCERPLRRRGNVVYWHFDPAKIYGSEKSLQQLDDGICVEPSAVDPNSRHFVGWSSDAGHLTSKWSGLIIARVQATCTVQCWLGGPLKWPRGRCDDGHMQWLPACRWLRRAAPQSCRWAAGRLPQSRSQLTSSDSTFLASSHSSKPPFPTIRNIHRNQQACASAAVFIHFAEPFLCCPRRLSPLPMLPDCTEHRG